MKLDFEEFCRKMRCKCFFRDKPNVDFSDRPTFGTKSSWEPPAGHAALELFLIQL